jgi:Flp pilus assembly protein TadD
MASRNRNAQLPVQRIAATEPTRRRFAHDVRPVWTINVRLLVLTIVVVVILAPTLYVVRAVQVRRNAGILFERAQEYERQGDLTAAARTLFRYLQFRPDDGPARVLLAESFDKTARTLVAKQRATEHYYRALAYFEDRLDLRSRLAELLLELNRSKEAEQESLRVLFGAGTPPRPQVLAAIKGFQDQVHGPKLLENNPQAARALRILATACFVNDKGEWSATDQMTTVTSALAANPANIELVLLKANLYRNRLTEPEPEARAKIADEFVSRSLSSHADVAQANLALYQYRLKHQLPETDAALDKALEAAPESYDVLLAAANRASSQNMLAEAVAYFTRASSASPTDPRAYAGHAALLLEQEKAAECVDVCRSGLVRCGDSEITLNLLLMQALIQSGKVAEAKERFNVLNHEQETVGPQLNLSQRLRLRDAIAVLEADLAIADNKPFRAATILQQLTVPRSGELNHADDVQARMKRWLRLALVYERIHYWELAAKAYDEAAALSTSNYQVLVAAARAWQAARQLDSAVAAYDAAVKASDAQPGGWVLLARAEIERQNRRAERDWTRADQALSEARRQLGETPTVRMLAVELMRAKGNEAAALSLLDSAIKAHPSEVLPFATLFYWAIGQRQQASAALEELQRSRQAGDRQVRALEAEICRRNKDYDRCKSILSGLIHDAEAAEKRDLRWRLALVELEHDEAQGRRQLVALAADYPEDLRPLERLADLSLSRHEYDLLAQYELALNDVEGSNGTLWRFYRAMRLVNQATEARDEQFAQAIRLHSELQALRPAWPSTMQLKGRIAQRQGRVQEAAEAYQAAVEAGATSVTVFEGLVTLLYANNRWIEADAFLSRLQQVGYQSPLLESFSSRLLLQQGDFEEAVAAAKSGVKLRPRDPLSHIWLGQTLVLASNRQSDRALQKTMIDAAKNEFERAVAVSPQDFRTWSGLLWFCARVGDKKAAADALEGLRSKAALSESQRMSALAQAYQLLGDSRAAEEHYLRAVQLLPRELVNQERLAQFYLSFAPEKAEPVLRRLLELAPASQTTRRALATLLAVQGADSQFDEAIRLLQTSKDENTNRRLQALLLMKRGGKANLVEARRLLEELIRNSVGPGANDRHLLALAAEADGDLVAARQQLEKLAGDSESATYLSALIEFLLRHDLPKDATAFVRRLNELEPNSFRTVQIGSRWLQSAARPAQDIKQLIERYQTASLKSARDDSQKLAVVNRVAGLYTQLDMLADAESCFRAFLRSKPNDESRQAFALWLVKKDRLADAVQLAMEGTSTSPPSQASLQLLSNVLAIAAARGLRFGDAEARIDMLTHEHSGDGKMLFELATLKHLQGQPEAARRLYEQSIQLVPLNALARNNLAMLLLDMPGADQESLQQIEEALRIAGPLPELRDTYALVLANQGKVEEARRILRNLLAKSPRNPRYLFHLAIAAQKAGDEANARDAFDKAQTWNLAAEALTPEERRMLERLRAGLGETNTAGAGSSRGDVPNQNQL